MALNFTTTEQSVQDAGIKVLTYAGSGSGKTVLCATAPTPIIISAESGLLSLKKSNLERMFGVGTQGITYDIPVILVSAMADLGDIYRWVTEAHEAKQFETICMDSLSEIGEKVLTNSKLIAKDPRQAYGDMAEKLIQLIKAYRDINGKNVYISAKMEKDKDEVTGAIMWQPMMPGKQVGPQLPYLFDEVFRMGVMKDPQGKEHRFLQTQPDTQYVAKDRSGNLAPLEAPNLTYLFNKIKGK